MHQLRCLALMVAVAAGALSAAAPAMRSTKSATMPASAPSAGRKVFDRWCAACHARGPGHPGTQSLAVKYHGSVPEALEDRTDLKPQFTAYFVRHGVGLMPFFRKTEIGDRDLQDLSAYLAKGK